jgi:hypothetical protein
LRAIGEVALPHLIEGGGRHEIDGFLPLAQQAGIGLQPLNCFMWNRKSPLKVCGGVDRWQNGGGVVAHLRRSGGPELF